MLIYSIYVQLTIEVRLCCSKSGIEVMLIYAFNASIHSNYSPAFYSISSYPTSVILSFITDPICKWLLTANIP